MVFGLRVGRVFDGERFLPGGRTVLVEGGTIRGIEPHGFREPDGCPVTTYDGTLLPGLVDTHVHLVGDGSMGALDKVAGYSADELDAVLSTSLAEQAAAGVTTVRDLGDIGYCTVARRERLGPAEPRIAAAGPPLTVPDGHCHFLGGVVTGETEIRAAVAERVERGVDVVKVMASGGMLTPGTDTFACQFGDEHLRFLVEAAHAAGLPVVAHAHALSAAIQVVAAGVDGLEHASLLSADGIVLPETLLADLVASRIAVCPTMGNDLSGMVGGPPPGLLASYARIGLTLEEAFARRLETVAMMVGAGVRLVNGVDAGVSPPKRHGNAWRAVVDLVRAGATVARALSAATSDAADVCGFGGVTGRIAAGYDADLLVVDGDLQADPDALGRPVSVVVRGTPL